MENFVQRVIFAISSDNSPEDISRIMKVFIHPLRISILKTMSDGRPRSASDLADELGERLANTSYHVTFLKELGVLEVKKTLSVRGAHKYICVFTDRWEVLTALTEAAEEPVEAP